MTIRRRLIISNILMIVIPVIIALIVAFGTTRLTWYWIKQISDKEKNIYNAYDRIVNAMVDAVEMKKDPNDIQKLLKEYNINVVIYDGSGNEYSYGEQQLQYQDILLQNIQTITEQEGYAGINEEEVYAMKKNTTRNNYTVCILYNFMKAVPDLKYYDALDQQFMIIVISTFVGILIAVILAIHFLSRSVFRKINKPLTLLANGVHQINEGNLDYRIVYKAKDEFAPVCEDFNRMAARLSQSIELTNKQEQNRKELIAGISHDLRSPLTSIKAYVEGLMDGVATTPLAQRGYMQMIKTKAEDIEHMVSKLFLFSKMDMGDYPYVPELLSLSQEIEAYVEATRSEYEVNGLSIHMTKLEPDVTIYADPLQLRSILANILENSLKYKDSPQGEAWISITCKEQQVRVVIEDDGPGVESEELGKLFQVFYRSDRSRSNPNRGSGLGLAITAKAIHYMGGTMYAENRKPKGLRIVMELSVAKDNCKQDALLQESCLHRGGK